MVQDVQMEMYVSLEVAVGRGDSGSVFEQNMGIGVWIRMGEKDAHVVCRQLQFQAEGEVSTLLLLLSGCFKIFLIMCDRFPSLCQFSL